MTARQRLRNRRASESFALECAGLKYVATVSRFDDGRIAELFLSNHRNNSGADTAARDAAIAFSFAVQHGADSESIRRALCRDGAGNACGPLGAALDHITESTNSTTGAKDMTTKAYDSTNRGAIFRNEQKDRDTDRDYAGELDVGGTEYWVSGWVKTSKKGTKFLSLSIKPKDAPPAGASKPRDVPFDDKIPF